MNPETKEKLRRQLYGTAAQMARDEGVVGEENMVVRVNEIVNDALFDEPFTDAGRMARTRALLQIGEKTPVDNPMTDSSAPINVPQVSTKPQFDWNKLRDETSVPAIVDILKRIGQNPDHLQLINDATPEYIKQYESDWNQLILDTFDILDTHNVGVAEYEFVFKTIEMIGGVMKEYCLKQIGGHKAEIMSRLMGAKNPGDGKYNQGYATYKTLKETLEKVRKDTGDNAEDYFTVVPKQ